MEKLVEGINIQQHSRGYLITIDPIFEKYPPHSDGRRRILIPKGNERSLRALAVQDKNGIEKTQ